jgi:hypothetical protein
LNSQRPAPKPAFDIETSGKDAQSATAVIGHGDGIPDSYETFGNRSVANGGQRHPVANQPAQAAAGRPVSVIAAAAEAALDAYLTAMADGLVASL